MSEVTVSLTVKGDIKKLALGPKDFVVVRLAQHYSDAEVMHSIAQQFRAQLKAMDMHNPVVVSDKNMDIVIWTEDEDGQARPNDSR